MVWRGKNMETDQVVQLKTNIEDLCASLVWQGFCVIRDCANLPLVFLLLLIMA